MSKNLRLIKSLWSIPEAFNKRNWPSIFAKIKKEGYHGVECFRPLWSMPGFTSAL